jgi:NADH-quinone oxidoreductase E subunit
LIELRLVLFRQFIEKRGFNLFSKDILTQVDNLLSRYPIKQNALIPILLLAQQENEGWLTEEWMQHVADICEVPLTHVEGVVTFYTMFRLKRPGKFHLQVCTCVPCCLVGGTELLEHTENKLNIHAGHTTADGEFSIEEMECIGACSFAPAIIVNEDYHEQVTPDKMNKLIDQLKQ